MTRIALLLCLMGGIAWGQGTGPISGGQSIQKVTVDPAGSCSAGAALQYNTTNGNLWGCNAGTWAVVGGGGGGSCSSLAGDVAGTCGASIVGGIESASINGSVQNGAGLIYDSVSGKWQYVVPTSGQMIQNGLISGGGVVWTGTGLNYIVSAATYTIAGVTYNSAQTALTLSAADPTNPRVDTFTVNDSGAAVVVAGTPAPSPVAAVLAPATQLGLTTATVPANATTPTITNDIIYQEDSGPSTEWTATSSGSGWNLASTSGCYQGTKCIAATAVAKTGFVNFAKGSSEAASTFAQLVFYIEPTASWANARSLSIAFSLSGAVTGNAVQLNNGAFGFVSSNTTSYQQIVIPMSQFAIPGNLDSLRMTIAGSGASTLSFKLDNIFLQTGNASGTQTGITSLCGNTGPVISAGTAATACGFSTSTSLTVNGQSISLGGSGNVNNGASNHTIAVNKGAGAAIGGVGPGTAHQYPASGGASADPAYQDHPDVLQIPFANCVSATAGSGPSTASSNFTAACRAGSNNLGGADQAIPSTGASLQFFIELPQDWDTSAQPYINVYYGSGSNTSGTVIWTASSACVDVSTPGGASDDPSFHAESAFSTQTMANANRLWFIGGQFTAMTSGNGCKAQSVVIVKLALSGTASANINAYYAVMTIPRAPVVQAN